MTSPFDYSGPSRVLTKADRQKKPGPKTSVLADNHGHHFCPPISNQAKGLDERDRSLAILGRRNESRTQ